MSVSKYRATKYDNYDEMYATRLSSVFKSASPKLQESFNELSDNLMAETHINRYSLLNALDDFKKEHYAAMTLTSHEATQWCWFGDTAFNYRPYQGPGW